MKQNLTFLGTLVISLLLFSACQEAQDKKTDTGGGATQSGIEKYSAEQLYHAIKYRLTKSPKTNKQDTIPLPDSLKKAGIEELYTVYMKKKKEKGIYCYDDRMEICDNKIKEREENANAVVSFFSKGELKQNADGSFSIVTVVTLKNKENLCDEQRFSNQPSNSFCSGFAIDKRTIVTAGHCIDNKSYKTVYAVFGYQMNCKNEPITRFKKEQVYSITAIMDRAYGQSDLKDFAVLMVDKDIPSNNIIKKSRTSGKIADNQAIYVIGHPSGLPLKLAPNAIVKNNAIANYFIANLDTYGGNSGSPVFNATTHELEGILVRGGLDYEEFGNCVKNFTCPCELNCDGEDISRTTQFLKWLKR